MSASVDERTLDFTDTYGYDSEGRVDCVARSGGSVALQSISLTYDDDGDLTEVDRYQNGVLAVKADYTYNSNDQLVGLVYCGASHATRWPRTPGRTTTRGCRPCCPRGAPPLSLRERARVRACPLSPWERARVRAPRGSWRQHAGHRHDADRLGPGPGRLPGAGQRDLLHLGRRHAELFLRCRRAAYAAATAPPRRPTTGTPTATRPGTDPPGTSYVIGNDNELLYDGTYRYAYDGEGNCVLRFKDPGDIDTIPTGSNGDTDITVYHGTPAAG